MSRQSRVVPRLAAVLCRVGVGALAPSTPALATYSGSHNGRLTFGMSVNDNVDIYSTLPNGHALQRLTTDPGFDACPAYSPDGAKIAFISDRTGIEQVWVMNADGTHQHQPTTAPITHDQLPDWSPDGSKIAYQEGDSPNGHIEERASWGKEDRRGRSESPHFRCRAWRATRFPST